MIVILDGTFRITIPDNKEYCIYLNDYFVDREGNVLHELHGNFDVFEYGDIIIQTENMKYTIERIYDAYQFVPEIIDYINARINDPVITVNLNELIKDWFEYHDGDFKAESI